MLACQSLSSVEVILRHAGEQEKEYDWVGAAKSYEKALFIFPNQDLVSLGQIHEKIGNCFCRAAFQAETCEEFKGRVRLAKDHYSNGAEFFVVIGKTASRTEFNINKAMASYVESWLAPDTSTKKERLDESWKFAKEALKLHNYLIRLRACYGIKKRVLLFFSPISACASESTIESGGGFRGFGERLAVEALNSAVKRESGESLASKRDDSLAAEAIQKF